MSLSLEQVEEVRSDFAQLRSKKDIVKLFNKTKRFYSYRDKAKPLSLRALSYYANPKLCHHRYTTFEIAKKSGGKRTINAPVTGLKTVLWTVNLVLQTMYEPHKAATGFVQGTSIVDNARRHVGQHCVYNIDLKDFFHSFDRNRVKLAFMHEPFNLRGEREPLAFLLACLVTHPFMVDGEQQIVLPQGSPTSPTLTNILCYQLDRRLTGLAKRFGLMYSRYADDITFSSPHNVYNDPVFQQELHRIIEEDQGLKINPKKTRLQRPGHRQEVTGLTVNEKVNVTRRYVKQIRMWLYYWERYGKKHAEMIFLKDYRADKGHVKKGVPSMDNVLDGKLNYLLMVKGPEDSTYIKLKRRFDRLTPERNPLNAILDSWEEQGIELAMEEYEKLTSGALNKLEMPTGTSKKGMMTPFGFLVD